MCHAERVLDEFQLSHMVVFYIPAACNIQIDNDHKTKQT